MVAITAPFGVLPMLAYTLTSLVIIYLGLRLVRYFRSRHSSALPKPVSGPNSKSITLLGGARSTASSWRQWSQSLPLPHLPQVRVPWVRIPSLSESIVDDVSAGVKTKNTKNLAIELLPTTGLPPPPSSAPIFSPTPTRATTPALQSHQQNQAHTQQLIDVSSRKSTPALTAASTAASGSSFAGSPRSPSPPQLVLHGHLPKAVYTPHPSYSRSPSPRSLLTTTPPTKHKRSRSLGGVPVRRLSSGAGSSLRNAVEMEDGDIEMGVLRKKKTGEEELLIDFSPSSSGSGEDDDPRVSPAASDIGVLSLNKSIPLASPSVYAPYASSGPYSHSGYKVAPSVVSTGATAAMLRVDARQVARHVPLVDLSDDDENKTRTLTTISSFDEDGWKWFAAGAGRSSISPATKTPPVVAKSNITEKEKLVDIDDAPQPSELVSDAQTPIPHENMTKSLKNKEDMPLVELDAADDREGVLVDVGFGDGSEDEDHWEKQYPSELLQCKEEDRVDTSRQDGVHYDRPRHDDDERIYDIDATSLASPSPKASAESPLPIYAPLILVPEPVEAILAPVSVKGPSEQVASDATWTWDDPWSGHLAAVDANNAVGVQTSELVEFNVRTTVEEEREEDACTSETSIHHVSDTEVLEEGIIIESSPAGLLKATVLDEDDDEAVPILDLEPLDLEASVPFETTQDVDAGEQQPQDIQAQGDDEEVTPTPTPASSHAELPPLSLPEGGLAGAEAQQVFERPAEVFYPDPELLELEDTWTPSSIEGPPPGSDIVAVREEEEFPDPGLLPLPLDNVAEKESAQESLNEVRSQLLAIADKGRPSTPTLSQTPTPPASPPPLHPISTVPTLLRPTKSRGASRVPSPTSTVNMTAVFPVVFPAMEEDKENAALTPTSAQQRPAWSLRASDAPALGLPSSGNTSGASPRGKRKALEDVNWAAVEDQKAVVVIEEKPQELQAEKVKISEQSQDKEAMKMQDVSEESKDVLSSEKADIVAPPLEPTTSLPGSFPDVAPPAIVVSPPVVSSSVSFPSSHEESTPAPAAPNSSGTVGQRIRRASLTARTAWLPSARNIVRSPLDIALAMQMRPGLGAGADPAWMVRFLMAVYGWLLVSVAGGDF